MVGGFFLGEVGGVGEDLGEGVGVEWQDFGKPRDKGGDIHGACS